MKKSGNARSLAYMIKLFWFVSWVFNFIKLWMCDFEAPFKEEFIHTIGMFVPLTSLITMWF